MTKKQQGPTQGVRLKEMLVERCQSCKEFHYSKMTEKQQGPTQGVRLKEVFVCAGQNRPRENHPPTGRKKHVLTKVHSLPPPLGFFGSPIVL